LKAVIVDTKTNERSNLMNNIITKLKFVDELDELIIKTCDEDEACDPDIQNIVCGMEEIKYKYMYEVIDDLTKLKQKREAFLNRNTKLDLLE
jgi:hypothetical protein